MKFAAACARMTTRLGAASRSKVGRTGAASNRSVRLIGGGDAARPAAEAVGIRCKTALATSRLSRAERMLGAMPRLRWKASKRVVPMKASRTTSIVHHSPTRSSERAMEQRMAAKLFRLMDDDAQNYYHYASLFSCIMIAVQR